MCERFSGGKCLWGGGERGGRWKRLGELSDHSAGLTWQKKSQEEGRLGKKSLRLECSLSKALQS